MSFKLFNVAHRGKIDPYWENRIQEHCKAHLEASHPLFHNYTPQGLDLAGHLTFDVLVDSQENLVTFCGVYSGGRFPPGVFRVLNRTYVAPEYRGGQKKFAGLTSKFILPHQLNQFKDEIALAFVSREHLKARHFLRRWVRENAPQKDWQVSSDLIHVAPKSLKKSAYQYVAFKKFRDIEWAPPSVTPEQWVGLDD